jgi:hypothetical protein
VSRYACVDDQKAAGFPVTAAGEVVEVSTSGYYHSKHRSEPPSARLRVVIRLEPPVPLLATSFHPLR